MNKIRVRIAPSPTGNLHIGTARSALFNYLYAKKRGGKFILRIEDTDLERSDVKFEKDIIDGLKWLGLSWDEGPAKKDDLGKYGPYRQSKRTDTYKKYLEKLFEKKALYHCFCSKEELEIERVKAQKEGKPIIYNGKCRNISPREAEKRIKLGEKSIIRYKTPDKTIEFNDIIRGHIHFETKLIGDIAIAKDLNTPLYNFAVVVDDITMKISHVIRGEDHISNTPKQILFFDALKKCHPIYAHLPLILGPDRSKLSKRHGATSIIEYKEAGFLPQAMVNFMALMGWNPKDEREYFTLADLTSEFNLENVNKCGAVFNIKKLESINSHYIKKMKDSDYLKYTLDYIKEFDSSIKDSELIQKALLLEKTRLNKFSELIPAIDMYTKLSLDYDKKLLSWKDMTNDELTDILKSLIDLLSKIPAKDYNAQKLEQLLFEYIKKQGLSNGELLWPLRVALSGQEKSPSPFELLSVLGKEISLQRIQLALDLVK